MAVQRIEIAPGYSISRLLKGGWQLASGHGSAVEREQAIRDMAAFVDMLVTRLGEGVGAPQTKAAE